MIWKLAYTFSDDPVVLCAWLRRSHPYLEHHLDTFLSLFFFAKFVQPTLVLLVFVQCIRSFLEVRISLRLIAQVKPVGPFRVW